MNQFDFYTVKASSDKIRTLTGAGVPRNKIERRPNGFAVYGRQMFRRWTYVCTLGYFELDNEAGAYALAAEWSAKGVKAFVSYHASE